MIHLKTEKATKTPNKLCLGQHPAHLAAGLICTVLVTGSVLYPLRSTSTVFGRRGELKSETLESLETVV